MYAIRCESWKDHNFGVDPAQIDCTKKIFDLYIYMHYAPGEPIDFIPNNFSVVDMLTHAINGVFNPAEFTTVDQNNCLTFVFFMLMEDNIFQQTGKDVD